MRAYLAPVRTPPVQVSRAVLLVGVLLPSAGCLGFVGDGEQRSRLDLTVQNEGSGPVDVQVTLAQDDGTELANESDCVDAGVARAFDFTVGTSGRHEVTVAGEDWRGPLAWNADACARYDATVRVSEGNVTVSGDCLEQH